MTLFPICGDNAKMAALSVGKFSILLSDKYTLILWETPLSHVLSVVHVVSFCWRGTVDSPI